MVGTQKLNKIIQKQIFIRILFFPQQQISLGRGNLSEAEMFVAKAVDIWKGVRTTSHTEVRLTSKGK